MAGELRVAVAGAGPWAGYQLAAWQELPAVNVVAVGDRDRGRAERLAGLRGVPAVYADVAEMLDRQRPDLLDIVTSVEGHAPLVRLAAERRVAVVTQKPMTDTLAGCEELVEACKQAGVFFAVHENWRWQAPLRRLRDVLASGAIGPPFRCRLDFTSAFDVFANQPGLRDLERFVLADMGCHLFDVARSLFGEAAAVYCQTARVGRGVRGEDVATAVLRMAGGAAVTVCLGYTRAPLENDAFPETRAFVEGPAGSVEVTGGCQLRVTTAAGTEVLDAAPPHYAWASRDYAVVHSSLVACHANIATALLTGGRAETDGADNLRTMRLVEAAYHSAATGEVVRITG